MCTTSIITLLPILNNILYLDSIKTRSLLCLLCLSGILVIEEHETEDEEPANH